MNAAAVLAIAGVEVRRRVRDRSLLIQGVLGPVALALIIGVTFGSTSESAPFTIRLLVVDEADTAVSRAVVQGLDAASAEPDGPPVTVVVVDSRDEAVAEVERTTDPALVLPAGFATSGAPIEVLSDPSRRVAGDLAAAVATELAATVDTVRLVTAVGGTPPTDPGDLRGLFVEETGSGGDFDAVSYFGPSMAMLFAFFTVGATARSLLAERRDGTLPRVRAAPVTDTAILAGKALAALVIGVVSVGTVWAVTALGFGADWGDPLVVAVVMVLLLAIIAGIGAIIAGFTRTDGAADSLTSATAFILAIIGGNFLRTSELPDALRTVSEATPNGLALRTLARSSAGGSTLSDETAAVATLAAMAIVIGVVGIGILARRIR